MDAIIYLAAVALVVPTDWAVWGHIGKGFADMKGKDWRQIERGYRASQWLLPRLACLLISLLFAAHCGINGLENNPFVVVPAFLFLGVFFTLNVMSSWRAVRDSQSSKS